MGIGRLEGTKFNLIMSVRHEASTPRLDQWRASFQRASEMIYDATDGQHEIGTIYVCNNSSGGRNADGWLHEEDGRSSAGGAAALGTETIHMTLFGDERFKPFVLCHELIHYLYGPVDEYSGPGGVSAECIGSGPPDDACILERGWSEGDRFGNDATGGALVIGDYSELCVAGNHDPDGDSHQSNVYGESCWETLVANYPALSIPSGTPTGPEPAGAGTIDWVLLAPEERFVVVLDRSGSMSGSKLVEAKFGADWWAQQTLVGELLGVLSYATTVSSPPDYPLQEIGDQTDRNNASAAITPISAGGSTAMGDAMRAALDQFLDLGQRASTQVVVLLTDGLTNVGESPATVLPDLVANGVRVYPIGIGPTIDAPLLESIATTTGGSLYRIDPALSAGEQETALRNALIEISGISRDGGGVVTTLPERIDEEVSESEVWIEKGSELATFGISWPHSKTLLFVELESPSGTIVGPGNVPANARELGRRDPWHGFHVHEPEPGAWKMRVGRESGEPGSPYRRFVYSRNRSIDGGIHVPRLHKPGARIPIGFELYHDGPLQDVDVRAIVTLPSGKQTQVELKLTGEQDTCIAGYYQGWFESTRSSGVHEVTIQVLAKGAARAAGGEKLVDGDPQTQHEVPTFIRTFSEQFLVGEESLPRFEIEPSEGCAGEKMSVVFKGDRTGWYQRGTRVGFGDGVTVHDLDVLGPAEMRATISIDPDTQVGRRTVTASTPRRHGTLALDDGFSIKPDGSQGSIKWPIEGLRLDPFGSIFWAVSGHRLLPIDRTAADTIIGLRRSGSSVSAETDADGNVTGFDVT